MEISEPKKLLLTSLRLLPSIAVSSQIAMVGTFPYNLKRDAVLLTLFRASLTHFCNVELSGDSVGYDPALVSELEKIAGCVSDAGVDAAAAEYDSIDASDTSTRYHNIDMYLRYWLVGKGLDDHGTFSRILDNYPFCNEDILKAQSTTSDRTRHFVPIDTKISSGLWRKKRIPEIVISAWETLKKENLQGEKWSYWRNWYNSLLVGEPLESELQKQIASIPDAIWQEGAEAIAQEIDRIRKPFDIRRQIIELEAELAKLDNPAPFIGHNNPPETIETATPQQANMIIWAELASLKKITDLETPSVREVDDVNSRFKMLADKAGTFVKDVAYDNSKTIATAGATSMAVTNWPRVQTLLMQISQMIDEWLAYIILGL